MNQYVLHVCNNFYLQGNIYGAPLQKSVYIYKNNYFFCLVTSMILKLLIPPFIPQEVCLQ